MAWMALFFAGVLEVLWSYAMKESQGFTRPWPSVATAAAMGGSVWLLAIAMRSLPLGTAYTIWTGIGAVGAFLVGVIVLGEPLSLMRGVAAALIVGGLVLMRLA